MVRDFQNFWQNLIQNPSFLGAFLVFVFGIIIAKFFEKLTISFLEKIKLNQLLKRIGMEEALSKIYSQFNATKFLGKLVELFFIILFLMFSFEILKWENFSQVLEKVVNYFPNIFISCFIFVVASFLVDFSQKVVVGTLEKEKIIYSRFIGKWLGWAIWILTVLAILYQLKIVPNLILVIFVGIVAIFVLGVGISFGLGGKDLASKILKELEEKFK